MVSRKTALVVIGAALLLGACQSKKDSPAAAEPDTSNATAGNAGMMEDIGNDSNAAAAANAMTEAAPAPAGFKHGERGNPDTRGSPLSAVAKTVK